jgi:hypothetical protein
LAVALKAIELDDKNLYGHLVLFTHLLYLNVRRFRQATER